MDWFQERVAVVAGSGRGIGYAVVEGLLQKGTRVAMLDVSPDISGIATGLEAKYTTQAKGYRVDISKPENLFAAVKDINVQWSKIDFLVNTAAIIHTDKILDTSYQEWQRVFSVNTHGSFLLTQAVLPTMMAARFGRIVFVTSVAYKVGGGLFGSTLYASTKAALACFTKGLARETKGQGILVNGIAPGTTETEMIKGCTGETRKALFDSLPMGRAAAPSEIAEPIIFLLSSAASYITGEILDVNGGLYMD